jgi:hypothetical protein
MLQRNPFILVVLSLLASPVPAQEPDWLVDARAREGKTTSAREIRSPDGWFKARVPAKLAGKVEFEDDAYSMTFDIGTGTPVHCEVIRDGFDPANLLRATASLTFEQLEPLQGRIEGKAVERVDAGAIGLSPYLEADWRYTANDGTGAKVGLVKQATAQKNGHGIYCSHIEIGYSRTFRDIFRSLVESIEMPSAEGQGEAYFVELGTMRMGDMRIGVSMTRLVRDEEGDTRATTASSMLVPAGGGSVHAQDTFTTEWVRPDGSLINQSHVELSNGEIGARLSLVETDEDGWWVEGEHMGKALEQSIEATGAPASSLRQAWQRRELLAGSNPVGGELAGMAWLAADPARFSDWRVEVTGAAAEGTYAARESIAGIVIDTVLDPATGLPVRFSMPLGPLTLEAERVALHGSF